MDDPWPHAASTHDVVHGMRGRGLGAGDLELPPDQVGWGVDDEGTGVAADVDDERVGRHHAAAGTSKPLWGRPR
jgi:hypothetical protein